jgi:hypothetical protein
MVVKKDKTKMKDFIVNRFEDSRKYQINTADNSHIFLMERPDLGENPKEFYVVLHNKKMPIKDYTTLVNQNNSKGIYTSDVFYKDDQNFMVRLGARGNLKGDSRTLKHYDGNTINKMVSLRGLEKKALEYQSNSEPLVYFQPESARLQESLRSYIMRGVMLDYSHIGEDNPAYGFVENRNSIDYKIAEEIDDNFISHGSVTFKPTSHYHRKVLIIPSDL